jgi:CRP/FNR family transcriptional regulator, cyclic AMP receptor protein
VDWPSGSFVAQLNPAERDALLGAGRRQHHTRGASLFTEGHTSGQVLVVLSGRVKVTTTTEDGRETLLGVRGPGDLLGELSAIDGGPHSGTVVALEPLDTLMLTAPAFQSFLAEHGHAGLVLLRTVTIHLRDADRKRVELAAFDAAGRVCNRLLELSLDHGEACGDGVRITVPLSQDELAGWTGLSREAVSKALRMLRENGWIETRRRGITVLDSAALRRRAGN